MIVIRAVWCNPSDLSQRRHSVMSISVLGCRTSWGLLARSGVSRHINQCHMSLFIGLVFHSIKLNATVYRAAHASFRH